ncbi:MTAP family purine nucleoside phosphorylase [Halobellus inordinatus]|uniref:MTAP family purine nucleoside phosphorylase n=1 Tax=Halobellus inordinatus TaxID=1126236 RepID=UPI00210CDA99|nr:MTAP family purine nucleoside phosphorylase [Halobellus inordinatus]
MTEVIHTDQLLAEPPAASVGITGGAGITTAIDVTRTIEVETPFGSPSGPLVVGEVEGTNVAFVSRHGNNHEIPSHSVNYRANIFALYALGVTHVVSAIAAGSLNEDIEPGSVVFPTDYIDWTDNRQDTFFDTEPVYHFSSDTPFCRDMIDIAMAEAPEAGLEPHTDAIVIVIEGPRFATRAESHMYRSFSADIINMSVYPEVALARELELCFLNLALITDFDIGDIGQQDADPVTLALIDDAQSQYNDNSTRLIERLVSKLPLDSRECCTGYKASARKSTHPEWDQYR